MCVSCSPGGERESGRNSWRSVSKFTKVRMQMEFPADYKEVKQTGGDKITKKRERENQALCHITLMCSINGANMLAKQNR